ncbi:MAG TPA: hypothetical protein DCS43_17380 [Verrucomicrobia bacterium]|nr:hypothetical protein [Verrucomicrobiota bacterium]
MCSECQHSPDDRPPDEQTFAPESPQQTLEWITVLSAASIPYRLSQQNRQWRLHLSVNQAEKAWSEIVAYELDRGTPCPDIPSCAQADLDARPAIWTAFWMVHILLLFYIWLGPFDPANPLHLAASGGGVALSTGEWWRMLTSLTLHADAVHLLANILFLFFIGQAVIRETGRGAGICLLLAAAGLGNLTAAWIAPSTQRSVGASTLCFAALGIISLYQSHAILKRHQGWRRVWKQAWIPLAAGIALLGMTGTDPSSDLAAHLTGFAAGVLTALATVRFRSRIQRLPPSVQWTLTALAATLITVAWTLAYRSLLHA